ncbi:ParB N-terminal domain-containing protein [Priestia megaterium]|uniref:ParB N-terminal domain-containing protein n=1 Tax=Priestia megaterium TaxID=1404 RepID=UPI002FFD9E02
MVEFKFVPIELVIPHEHICDAHTTEVSKSILNSGYLKHPIQAIELGNRFMILDGHHRFNALKSLQVNYIPLQIIKESDITLKYWYHTGDFLQNIKFEEENYLNTNTYTGKFNNLGGKTNLYSRYSNKLLFIWNLFKQYEDKGYIRKHQSEGENWIRYDGVTLDDIKKWASRGDVTPPGITRFIINYRILNLNIPLNTLYESDYKEWQKVQGKLSKGRLYEECVLHID